jgi:hypothetical protein
MSNYLQNEIKFWQMFRPHLNKCSLSCAFLTPLNNTIGMIDLYNKRMRIFAMIDFLYHYPNKNTLSQCDFTTDDDAYFKLSAE